MDFRIEGRRLVGLTPKPKPKASNKMQILLTAERQRRRELQEIAESSPRLCLSGEPDHYFVRSF